MCDAAFSRYSPATPTHFVRMRQIHLVHKRQPSYTCRMRDKTSLDVRNMSKIRTAILGYGRSGSTMHAGAIEKIDAFDMVAVCDIDPKRRTQASERFDCTPYADYHEMLAKEELDLVCVITRNDQHCDMACDCLKAGVNVLVTKPWAANQAEAERMVLTARRTGKKLLPWLPARWGSELQRLKALQQEDAIGNIFTLRRTVASFGTRCDWQTESKFAGGYLLNWGPHIVDPLILLAGGKVKHVFGRLKQTINPGDVEDLFLAIITMDNGVTVQVEHTISLAPMPSWIAQGDRGTITIDGKEMTIVRGEPACPDDPTKFQTMKAEGNETTRETLAGKTYGDEDEIYEEIAAAVRGEQEFAVKPEDALELSRILDAIRTSNAEDRVVNL